MSLGIGTQFTATLSAGQTQTWFTWGWDPNYLVFWPIRPTTQSGQVRLDSVSMQHTNVGITYNLTITNIGPSTAAFEPKYYFKTIIAEGDWQSVGPDHLSGCIVQVVLGAWHGQAPQRLVLEPTIYDQALQLSPTDNGLARTTFFAALTAFIGLLGLGVSRRWRRTFWLLLIAFQGAIGVVQFAIGLVVLTDYGRSGVWGLARRDDR